MRLLQLLLCSSKNGASICYALALLKSGPYMFVSLPLLSINSKGNDSPEVTKVSVNMLLLLFSNNIILNIIGVVLTSVTVNVLKSRGPVCRI